MMKKPGMDTTGEDTHHRVQREEPETNPLPGICMSTAGDELKKNTQASKGNTAEEILTESPLPLNHSPMVNTTSPIKESSPMLEEPRITFPGSKRYNVQKSCKCKKAN